MLQRTNIKLRPDHTRVIIRTFIPYDKDDNSRVTARIMSLTEKEVKKELHSVLRQFADRHIDMDEIFLQRYNEVERYKLSDREPSEKRKLLIGAYFTSEYSLESAALFNPSIVPHPDQSNIPKGALRFIVSLRAVGEGHISSITFREGIINEDLTIDMDKPGMFTTIPIPEVDIDHEKSMLANQLFERQIEGHYTEQILQLLPETYNLQDLKTALKRVWERDPKLARENNYAREAMKLLTRAGYQINFENNLPLSSRVIFPNSPTEKMGIEDARFVLFKDESGASTYYASYTAWSGKHIIPQLLETKDFLHFKMLSLTGEAVQNKGMALFPEKIDGKFASLSRRDGENMFIIFSDDVRVWREAIPLLRPTYPWEIVKVGNCGSPIKLDEGWLVITHGVGPMRRYCLGAVLLDNKDPTKVIGRLEHPLLEPLENEREGYVPNVVYSCGGMAFNGKLVLPYAMSDYASRIAVVDIGELLSKMK